MHAGAALHACGRAIHKADAAAAAGSGNRAKKLQRDVGRRGGRRNSAAS